jgi:hypothetical protein
VELPSEFSDGSSSKWPMGAQYVWAPADTIYHEKLADEAKELIQGSRNGKTYFISFQPSILLLRKQSCPQGYARCNTRNTPGNFYDSTANLRLNSRFTGIFLE